MSLVISVSCSVLVQWFSLSTYLHFTNATFSDKQEQQLWQFKLCDCYHEAFCVCYYIILLSEIKCLYLLVFMCISKILGWPVFWFFLCQADCALYIYIYILKAVIKLTIPDLSSILCGEYLSHLPRFVCSELSGKTELSIWCCSILVLLFSVIRGNFEFWLS